jgi:hypothetical protein
VRGASVEGNAGAALLGLLACLAGCHAGANQVTDLERRKVDPLSPAATATVLIFASASCPISNRYAPELGRLYRRFAARGVAFYLVYTDLDQPVEGLRRHAREHEYPFAALRDPARELVRPSHVTVTPEAAVFLPGRRLVYHGRIDDRFVDFGKERAAPGRHDLADTLEALLAGRAVPAAATAALGCSIR